MLKFGFFICGKSDKYIKIFFKTYLIYSFVYYYVGIKNLKAKSLNRNKLNQECLNLQIR